MNLWIIFLTGLTTGGLSCLAMQGGLLTSVIANQKRDELAISKNKKLLNFRSFDYLDWMPVLMFLVSKLFIHTVFGFMLGGLGATITLSLNVRLGFQIFTAVFMFATAMNLLNVHPIFRFLSFKPPKFIRRQIFKSSKSKALFAPAILGLMTIFIPCGVTQAMELLAINTADPVQGALIMFAFVLGTFPLFGLVGIATAKLSEGLTNTFMKFAAIVLILMALYGLHGVLVVIDSPLALNNIESAIDNSAKRIAGNSNSDVEADVEIVDGVQKVNIEVLVNGYYPAEFTVRQGVPVELSLNTNGVYSCATSFVMREFDIFTQLKPTDKQTFEFTPSKKGNFTFACSMGMYRGVMRVI